MFFFNWTSKAVEHLNTDKNYIKSNYLQENHIVSLWSMPVLADCLNSELIISICWVTNHWITSKKNWKRGKIFLVCFTILHTKAKSISFHARSAYMKKFAALKQSRLHWAKKAKKHSFHTLYVCLFVVIIIIYSCFFFSFHSLLYAEKQFINCVRFNVKCSIAQCKCRPMSYIGRSTAIQIPIQCVWNKLTIHYTHFNWIDALRTHNFISINVITVYFPP